VVTLDLLPHTANLDTLNKVDILANLEHQDNHILDNPEHLEATLVNQEHLDNTLEHLELTEHLHLALILEPLAHTLEHLEDPFHKTTNDHNKIGLVLTIETLLLFPHKD